MKLPTLAKAALAALCLAAPAAHAFDVKNMTPDEKSAFDAQVRSYLLAHPEVLVEAIKKLDAKQAQAQANSDADLVKANAQALFHDPNSWVGGNPKGDITLVEFMDYRCGYCHKAYPEIAKLLKTDGNIRFIVKEYPILTKQSVIGARFAIAVLQLDGPEAYGKVHDALMTMRGEIDDASLARLGDQLGIDAKAAIARMESAQVTKVIEANRELGDKMQVNGTPTFVLGDTMLRGYVPYAQMQEIVKEMRTKENG